MRQWIKSQRYQKMWLDLLNSERAARSAQHQITSRAEVFMAAGLDLERVLDALSLNRANWSRRVEELRAWEAEQSGGVATASPRRGG